VRGLGNELDVILENKILRIQLNLRAVPLRLCQRRQRGGGKELCETFAVPTSGKPLFQAARANLNPWTEAKVDTEKSDRGAVLIISGENYHTVPWALAHAAYKQQEGNDGLTEIVEIKGRGHALIIDSGWQEVADTALAFIKRTTQLVSDQTGVRPTQSRQRTPRNRDARHVHSSRHRRGR
jgi:hypothetical protein